MDMLRYQKFTGGQFWADEYGSSNDSTAVRYLAAYSPLHNLKPGTCYPATLVTTADHDDRVVPAHSFEVHLVPGQSPGTEQHRHVLGRRVGALVPTDVRVLAEVQVGLARLPHGSVCSRIISFVEGHRAPSMTWMKTGPGCECHPVRTRSVTEPSNGDLQAILGVQNEVPVVLTRLTLSTSNVAWPSRPGTPEPT